MKPNRGAYLRFPSKSRPVRGAWIEALPGPDDEDVSWSRPVRGAWIETEEWGCRCTRVAVAPRAGRVD